MNFPENLLYTNDHEWIKIEGDIAFVGITEFAQKELGDIVFVDINTLGSIVEKHGVFGTIEAVKTVSDLFLPVKGEILEVNPIINDQPEKVNQDPYGEGWIVKIKVLDTDYSDLLNAEAYKATLNI
jgi:glycine cleavage system H protein